MLPWGPAVEMQGLEGDVDTLIKRACELLQKFPTEKVPYKAP